MAKGRKRTGVQTKIDAKKRKISNKPEVITIKKRQTCDPDPNIHTSYSLRNRNVSTANATDKRRNESATAIVLLDRCSETEHLISTQCIKQESPTDVEQDITEIPGRGDEVVSTVTSNDNVALDADSDVKMEARPETPSGNSKLTYTLLKITTGVKESTRKIDLIEVPIDTVSIKTKKSKLVKKKKKKYWNIPDNMKLIVNIFENLYSVNSSNELFQNASLDLDYSITGTPKKLLIAQGTSSNSPSLRIKKWSSKESLSANAVSDSQDQNVSLVTDNFVTAAPKQFVITREAGSNSSVINITRRSSQESLGSSQGRDQIRDQNASLVDSCMPGTSRKLLTTSEISSKSPPSRIKRCSSKESLASIGPSQRRDQIQDQNTSLVGNFIPGTPKKLLTTPEINSNSPPSRIKTCSSKESLASIGPSQRRDQILDQNISLVGNFIPGTAKKLLTTHGISSMSPPIRVNRCSSKDSSINTPEKQDQNASVVLNNTMTGTPTKLLVTRGTRSNISPIRIKRRNSKESRSSIRSVEDQDQIINTNKIISNTLNIQSPPVGFNCSVPIGALIRSESSGYHSEQKSSDISPSSSTVSSPNRRISADSSDHCDIPPIRKTTFTNNVQNAQQQKRKRKYDFKTPKLPNIKRPPTRIKTPEDIDVKPPPAIWKTKRQHSPILIPDDTDVISLYAESCFDTEESPPVRTTPKRIELNLSPGNSNLNAKKNVLRPSKDHLPQLSNTKINVNCDEMKADEKVEPPKPILIAPPIITSTIKSPISQHTNYGEVDTSKVNNWIASTSTAKGQITTAQLMGIFKKLCHNYYRDLHCRFVPCRYFHQLPPGFVNILRELTEHQFQLALAELLTSNYMFREAFDMILICYKEKDQPDQLIDLIDEVLKLNFDKTPYIKKIILTLKDVGYTFVDAIDEILLTHGRKQQILLDILLTLIVEEDDCLENNWHIIDKLTKFRKNKLDYGVVNEIFGKCCNKDKPRKDFCENIYRDLIIKSHIDLDQIDRNLVIKYINLLYQFNLYEYAEQLKQNNGIQDYEVVIEKLVNNDDKENTGSEINSKNDSSYSNSSSSTTSSSSSSSSTHENNYESNAVNDRDPAPAESFLSADQEEVLDYSFEAAEDPDNANDFEEPEEMEREEPEEVAYENPVDSYNPISEANGPIFQSNLPLQHNNSYTNSDLDIFLNCVNRDTYSTNYYRPEQPCMSSSSPSEVVKLVATASTSGHSKSSPSFQRIIPRNPTCDDDYQNTIDKYTDTRVEPVQTDLSNIEVERLVTAFKYGDLSAIFNIMNKCCKNNMCRSFVAHTVSAFSQYVHPSAACKLIWDIFDQLKNLIKHQINSDSSMKELMKLLAFNILPFLDQRKAYGTATRLIALFATEMDSFVETKCIRNYSWLANVKLRYIFIFKLYVRDKKLKDALKLLKSSSLNLFQNLSVDTEVGCAGIKTRVLTEFMELSMQRDLQVAREAIVYLILNTDSLQDPIDLLKYLNNLLVKLLNCYSCFKFELLGLMDNITNRWFKYLNKSVMRALLVQLFYDLPEKKLIEFMNLCVDTGIYRIHEGNENSIGIPANLLPEEIQLILHIHFHRICLCNFPLHNIVINVELQIDDDEFTQQLNIFTNSLVDCRDMITRILNVFARFPYFPCKEKMTISAGLITIPYEYLKHFFKPYRTGLPSIIKLR